MWSRVRLGWWSTFCSNRLRNTEGFMESGTINVEDEAAEEAADEEADEENEENEAGGEEGE